MLVIVAKKVEWRLANMLASRSSVRFTNDMEGTAPKHCSRGRKLPDRCHRAKTRNERNQQATHSLGNTVVLRYTHHAETPTRQVGFSLSLALKRLFFVGCCVVMDLSYGLLRSFFS